MEITYDEMRELAYAGFTVLHEEALLPAYRKGIPVNIRNTNNPTARGTMIRAQPGQFRRRRHRDCRRQGLLLA